MRNFTFLILIFTQSIAVGQVQNYNELISKLKYLELPVKIDVFSSYEKKSANEISLYNAITEQGAGYIGHNNKFHKVTSVYENEVKTRSHERYVDGKYEEYQIEDSVKVYFLGILPFSNKFTCILAKIEDMPNDFQKAYYYQLLSYNDKGEHLSSIVMFELIDDAATKDWIKDKPLPNVTSIINKDGSIEIKWDEGNDEIFIQHVKLNPEGIFYVEKLERMEK